MVKAGADEWREYLRIYGKKSVRVVREKTQDLRKRARAGRVQALRGDKTMKQLSLFRNIPAGTLLNNTRRQT